MIKFLVIFVISWTQCQCT